MSMTTTQNDEKKKEKDELDELVEFLSDKRSDVRKEAATIVAGLTGTDDGLQTLTDKKETLISPLLHLLGKDPPESTPAAQALINLTGHSLEVASVAVSKGAVERCIDFIKDSECAPVDLLLSLLANITKAEGGVQVPCGGSGCTAIIDSGTSLIAAPGSTFLTIKLKYNINFLDYT